LLNHSISPSTNSPCSYRSVLSKILEFLTGEHLSVIGSVWLCPSLEQYSPLGIGLPSSPSDLAIVTQHTPRKFLEFERTCSFPLIPPSSPVFPLAMSLSQWIFLSAPPWSNCAVCNVLHFSFHFRPFLFFGQVFPSFTSGTGFPSVLSCPR